MTTTARKALTIIGIIITIINCTISSSTFHPLLLFLLLGSLTSWLFFFWLLLWLLLGFYLACSSMKTIRYLVADGGDVPVSDVDGVGRAAVVPDRKRSRTGGREWRAVGSERKREQRL